MKYENGYPVYETYRRFGNNGVWRQINYNMGSSTDCAKYLVRERFAWPGGYQLYAVMDDGGALCADCVRENFRSICESAGRDGWTVSGLCINYEEEDLHCDHCYRRLEPEYK